MQFSLYQLISTHPALPNSTQPTHSSTQPNTTQLNSSTQPDHPPHFTLTHLAEIAPSQCLRVGFSTCGTSRPRPFSIVCYRIFGSLGRLCSACGTFRPRLFSLVLYCIVYLRLMGGPRLFSSVFYYGIFAFPR